MAEEFGVADKDVAEYFEGSLISVELRDLVFREMMQKIGCFPLINFHSCF